MFSTGVEASSRTDLSSIADLLRDLDQNVNAATRIDRIRLLEELRSVVAAVQAREAVAFADAEQARQRTEGVPAARVSRGIAAQVGLARRLSPHAAARYLGQVRTLTRELPECMARFTDGAVAEARVLTVALHTAWLSAEGRAAVDGDIAGELPELGNRKLENRVQQLAYRLDPAGFTAHRRRAESERYVSVRPAPDTMAWLTALLPMAQAAACYGALSRAADLTVGHGSEARGRGQTMADTLVQRLTGQASADAVPVTVNLVMTDQALHGHSYRSGTDEPAHLDGAGTIPAEYARDLIRAAHTQDADTRDDMVWLRRLYTDPATGQLAAMDSTARRFTRNQARFLLLRDQICRTPYCDAAIQHADHVTSWNDSGPTEINNGQGLCEACNYAKQAPGWKQESVNDEIVTTTPTGHRYRSRPPDPPGTSDTIIGLTRLKRGLVRLHAA